MVRIKSTVRLRYRSSSSKKFAGGRADLLAEAAGMLESVSEGELDERRACRAVASVGLAGADIYRAGTGFLRSAHALERVARRYPAATVVGFCSGALVSPIGWWSSV